MTLVYSLFCRGQQPTLGAEALEVTSPICDRPQAFIFTLLTGSPLLSLTLLEFHPSTLSQLRQLFICGRLGTLLETRHVPRRRLSDSSGGYSLPILVLRRRNDDSNGHFHEHEHDPTDFLSSSLPDTQKERTFNQRCSVGSATHVSPITSSGFTCHSYQEAG